MGPLRLLILAALFYIGYRLLVSGQKKKHKNTTKQTTKQGPPDLPVNDVLVEDPVCHSLVPKQQAIHLQHRGSMVYFCSEECCNKFIAQEGEAG